MGMGRRLGPSASLPSPPTHAHVWGTGDRFVDVNTSCWPLRRTPDKISRAPTLYLAKDGSSSRRSPRFSGWFLVWRLPFQSLYPERRSNRALYAYVTASSGVLTSTKSYGASALGSRGKACVLSPWHASSFCPSPLRQPWNCHPATTV